MNQPIHKSPVVWSIVIVILALVVSIVIWSGAKPSAQKPVPPETATAGGITYTFTPAAAVPTPDPGVMIGPVPAVGRRGGADRTVLDEQVQARQKVKDTTNEITIDLKTWINATLTDPLYPVNADNNLATLPIGKHIYGGVPFDVEGLVRLASGNTDLDSRGAQPPPPEVKGIKIAHKFKKLHVFHGGLNFGPNRETVIAKIVLHYADGSQADLNLVEGLQLLQCIAPYYQPAMLQQLDVHSELGWVGLNPFIQERRPNAGVHVYRTSFDNPKPDVEVTSVDYVSGMSAASPFLVGLTIE